MIPRPCLGCGTPTPANWCPTCKPPRARQPDTRRRGQRHYTRDYRNRRTALLATATTCHWCGQPPTPTDPLQADHLIAGDKSPGTPLVAAHRSCNIRRSNEARAAG